MNNTLLVYKILSNENTHNKLFDYFTNYTIEESCTTKEYAIETYNMLKQGKTSMKEVNRSFEQFVNDYSLIKKFTTTEIEYFGLEDKETDKPNIFIRIWQKFVAAIKKIFGAIIRFFKFIINKIVSFVKWLIGKVFKKKRSKTEVKQAFNMFDRYAEKSFEDNIISTEAKNLKHLFTEKQIDLLSVIHFDNETYAKINTLVDITEAFVISAQKIMEQQLIRNQVVNYTRIIENNDRLAPIVNNIEYTSKLKQSSNSSTLTTIARTVKEYLKCINNLSNFMVYDFSDDLDNKYLPQSNIEEIKTKTKLDGTLIAKACLCKDAIKNVNDLKTSNFLPLSIIDIIDKQCFMKIYIMPDDYKKDWIEQSKKITNSLKKLEGTLKRYENMVDSQTKILQQLQLREGKENINDIQAHYLLIRHQTEFCVNICRQVINTSQYVFKVRVTMIEIVNTIQSYFQHIKKEEIEKANGNEIQTMYGPLIRLNPEDIKHNNFDTNLDFKKCLQKISRKCLESLLGETGENKIIKEKFEKEQFTFFYSLGNKCYSHIQTNKKIDNTIQIDCKFENALDLKIIRSLAGIPIELYIAGIMIHETVHKAHSIIFKGKDNNVLHANADEYDPDAKKKFVKEVKKNGSIKKLLEKPLESIFLNDFEKQKQHVDSTAYRHTLIEVAAEKKLHSFIIDAINRIKGIDNCDKAVFFKKIFRLLQIKIIKNVL